MRALVMRKTVLLSLLLLVLLAMALIVWSVMTRNDHRTNDAWVNADYTLVAPKVSGYIASVRVKDNQQVAAGELLATLDDRDYKVALESAEAALQVSEAKLLSSKAQLEQQQSVIDEQKASVSASQASAQYAGQSAERYNRLYQRGTVAADEQQKASSAQRSASAAVRQSEAALASAIKQVGVLQAAVRSAEADVAAARASVDQARLNLSYTRIVAPVAGMVGQRAVRLGAYVSAGTRLLAVVPLQQTYITANYLETQLQDVRPGQPVRIRVDALPDQIFTGHVDSIAPATGATFAAIAPDNATGNYTKVVQRLPVKIVLDQNQKNLAQLRVGMSAVPDIDVR
ncbi:HlyD family secretion protein [Pantoea stewartii]|uniref:Efflux transporter periplasmic adaptor subunit n=1 Tax=Pantoea stewartii subsp. stewartii DC283 TaxID=660596 RepID=H3RFW0_PANSE|nr:HlyD family secretion protein [Pantoea stewartii]ARF51057.1 efflux transporter periplasmic adaptor subunit [Pantoea stewartii subsp. stewartii DC283]EHT99752.1 HlyD family secretion protein [Pantoea stewartii subsp. stewartii DC283]KAB0551470.1 HlyD family secretion protein [Pantoea stewartii subsp. stewartii]MDK2634784.1 HlyD family secretion protein [Pantoea stewartii subsp. indologenes]QIE96761.1 HlyD family secretion protein [Pantoea stewartii]